MRLSSAARANSKVRSCMAARRGRHIEYGSSGKATRKAFAILLAAIELRRMHPEYLDFAAGIWVKCGENERKYNWGERELVSYFGFSEIPDGIRQRS